MGCLFAIFAGCFPRLGTLFIWIARPQLFSDAFGGSWFVPLLGIIFLPFTTLMYVILWSPVTGIANWDWLWLVLAVLIDLSHWVASARGAYEDRDRIPGYASA
jgi:hypothetical protein